MSEWASKIMNAVLPDRNKGDFDQYLTEVSNDQAERMYFQKEIDIEYECRPTYEQLSIDRIIDEANRNVSAIKTLENLIMERLAGFSSFAGNITKYRSFVECFENSEGTLRVSIDTFCLFIDQELQQSKQQIFLGDLKRSLMEVRNDSLRRIQEYQREIANAEQDLTTVEKKITKLKEKQEKNLAKGTGDTFADLESLVKGSRKSSTSFSQKDHNTKDGIPKPRDADDSNTLRYEKEISEEIRNLLRSISNRDQVLSASRKAFQKLDRECKRAIYYTLRKILDKEKEHFEMQKNAMDKLDRALQRVDIEADLNLFIQNYRHEEGSLVLNSHALSLLSDLIPTQGSRNPSPSSSFSGNQPQHHSGGSSSSHHLHSSASSPLTPSSTAGIAASSRQSISLKSNKKESKRSSFRSSFTSSKASSESISPVGREPATVPNPPVVSPAPVSQIFAEEYSKHLTNIFYAVDEKKLTLTGGIIDDETEEEENSETNDQSIVSNVSNVSNDGNEDAASTGRGSGYMRTGSGDDMIPTPQLPSSSSSPPSNPPSSFNPRKILTHDEADKDPYSQKFVIQRRFSLNAADVKSLTKQEINYIAIRPILHQSVEWLCNNVRTTRGREAFIAELNQFRSKKVDLQAGFGALVIVMWTALTYCQRQNDVRTAKVLMMLSQTFYRVRPESQQLPGNIRESEIIRDRSSKGSEEEDEEEEIARRGVLYRQFIKEKILGHPLWEDGNYWEQALWQCAIEQLQTIPYERPWYDMDRENRDLAVRRVHDVVFSQVMAITHSMMELGCSQQQTREFLYRMCVVHQLSESQRQQLLTHILRQKNESGKAF